MSKFYMDNDVNEPITEIVWVNSDGQEEVLSLSEDKRLVELADESASYMVIAKDIDKLIAALQKAKELGWGG